jgi:catechol 2,3-dioxygenase-like lactoylglutathione lyase family enzyme
MLSAARYQTTLPCSDLERAKSFYADKLGLIPADDRPGQEMFEGRVFYEGRDGGQLLLFLSNGRASGSFTQMGFSVADIDAEVRDLKQQGVQFEEYDFPGFDQATGIAQTGDHRAAWFKDSEGNLLVIVQLPVGAFGRSDT